MLDKTNYTTRTDLSPEEIRALVTVRTKLETGEISLNMGNCCNCIGGHMMVELGVASGPVHIHDYVYESRHGKFAALFWPRPTYEGLLSLTQEGGIQAITNFLNGSDKPWA